MTRRLATLRAASTAARTGTGGGVESAKSLEHRGRLWSDLPLRQHARRQYRRPGAPGSGTAPSAQTQSSNSLYNDLDVLARRRGQRFDMLARTSLTYAKNFAGTSPTSGNDSSTRVSIASVELDDRVLNVFARLGRQVQNFDGALGTFDGLFAAWQMRPEIGVNLIAGFPVEQTNMGLQTARKFWSVAVPYTPVGKHWDASVFYTQWHSDGFTDREAVGTQLRLLLPNASVTALLDYDIFYQSLNTAAILGTMQLPALWNLSFDAERRNAPVLTTQNALIGQPFRRWTSLRNFTNRSACLPTPSIRMRATTPRSPPATA